MPEQTSVVTLCMNRIVELVESEMMDPITDETQLGLARAGRLQSNPLAARLNLLVREGGDQWPDILIPANHSLYAPQYEMPWGETWLRRMIADYELFLFGVGRSEARAIAMTVFSRFKWLIGNMNVDGMQGLTDDFGETAVMVHSTKLRYSEGGGPASNFIWRGVHYIEFMTNQGFEQ